MVLNIIIRAALLLAVFSYIFVKVSINVAKMVKFLLKLTFLGWHHNMVTFLVKLPTSCEVIVVRVL